MDNNEVKSAVETLGKTFESFKQANNERLSQVEAKGTADPVTEAKLSKIQKDMDKFADLEVSMKAQAEAKKQACTSIYMTVISVRKELIDWYVRHGYQLTGERKPFAFTDPRFGQQKMKLEFVVLEKKI